MAWRVSTPWFVAGVVLVTLLIVAVSFDLEGLSILAGRQPATCAPCACPPSDAPLSSDVGVGTTSGDGTTAAAAAAAAGASCPAPGPPASSTQPTDQPNRPLCESPDVPWLAQEDGSSAAVTAGGNRSAVRPYNDTEDAASPHCSGHGVWVRGRRRWCDCHFGWKGDDCSIRDDRPPRNCMFILMFGSDYASRSYMAQAEVAIEQFNRYMVNATMKLDIIVLYGGYNIPDEKTFFKNMTAASTRFPIKYLKVDFDFPPSLKEQYTKSTPRGETCNAPGLQYLHHVRFLDYTVFTLPIMKDYDYVWRLDADLFLLGEYVCDPFATMIASKAVFGYHVETTESIGCQGPIAAICYEYAMREGFHPNHLQYIFKPNMTAYAGAFGIWKWSFWTHPETMRFLDYFDRGGWAYRYRVADQVLFPHALGLFVPKASITKVGGFAGWAHKSLAHKLWSWYPDPYCKPPQKQ